MRNKLVKWGWVFLILLVTNGCATYTETTRKPEDIVRQRINERWNALVDGRMETAYTYEMPEYKELYSFVEYRKRNHGAGVWRKMDIESLVCEANKCSADIKIHVTIKFGLGFEDIETYGQANEVWMQHSATGQWYHVSDH